MSQADTTARHESQRLLRSPTREPICEPRQEGRMDLDETHEDEAAPVDPDEQHELAMDRRNLLKRVGLGAAALTVPAAVLASPAFGAVTDALAADSFIKSHPNWKFVFVNHVTTNPFFVPTIYGAQDACSLLGCSYQWTGRPRPTSARWSMRSTRRSPRRRQASHAVSSTSRLSTRRRPAQPTKAFPCSPTTRTCPPGTRTSGWRTSARISTRPGMQWVSASSISSRKAMSRCSSPPPVS